MTANCDGPLHPQAIEGIRLFNAGKFFDAHEELEAAWRAEKEDVRNLYQGIIQVAVCYLHITRGNYDGAVKMYGRSLKWLKDLPDICRGVRVGKLREDAEAVMNEVQKVGAERIKEFDLSLFKPAVWNE